MPGTPRYPPLLHITIDGIQQGLDAKTFSSVDLANACIARIHEVESTLNAVVEINPDALSIAEQLDDEREKHGRRGPLHGVPVLLKDNTATTDRMKTTAGSLQLLHSKPSREATVVERLRKAGAIILGKTNLSEWNNLRSKNSSNGWSARGGQTYAAYHDRQDPSGSSSGSAVGVAVGLAPLAIGTEVGISFQLIKSHIVDRLDRLMAASCAPLTRTMLLVSNLLSDSCPVMVLFLAHFAKIPWVL